MGSDGDVPSAVKNEEAWKQESFWTPDQTIKSDSLASLEHQDFLTKEEFDDLADKGCAACQADLDYEEPCYFWDMSTALCEDCADDPMIFAYIAPNGNHWRY